MRSKLLKAKSKEKILLNIQDRLLPPRIYLLVRQYLEKYGKRKQKLSRSEIQEHLWRVVGIASSL